MREIYFGLSDLERQTPGRQNLSYSIAREGGEIKSEAEAHQIPEILANLAKIRETQNETAQRDKGNIESPKKSDPPAGRLAAGQGRHGWEPFNLEPESEQKFVNLYGGVYSAQMELNRIKAEELIRVAALEGQIVLNSLSPVRARSIEINPDMTTTAKRGLFRAEKVEDEENPNFRVTSIPQGWKIEICDQRIRDELSERYSGEKLQKKFVARFNQYLRTGIWQAICREKLTGEKYKIIERALDTLLPTGVLSFVSIVSNTPAWHTWLIFQPVGYALLNTLGRVMRFIKQDDQYRRSLQSIYEYFMPEVEIDRVARGFSYLNLKGRNLVRLKNKV